jgi:hypothetical protein
MPVDHTPLDPTRLSPAAQRALAPGPGRTMAARGLVPLPRPGELAAVLYQLGLDGDPAIADAARATMEGLPEKVVLGALADAEVDPRVVDWLALRHASLPTVHDAIVMAPAVHDLTIVRLAARGDSRAVDLIAQNEQRLLRCPDIIAAMYGNPRARMSTVDRAIELAIRNHVRVQGIAAWEELCRVLQAGVTPTTSDDAVFAQAVAGVAAIDDSALTTGDADKAELGADGELLQQADPTLDDKQVPIDKLAVPSKIRLATIGNAFARSVLIRDPIKMVALAAIKAPGVTDIEAARYAGNQQLADEVVRYIAGRREWTRLYGVKMHLIMNPKAPLSEVTRFLPHIREKDLRNIAKSKGVPSAVAAQARKLLTQRSSGGKH